jgi:hypothetical protein
MKNFDLLLKQLSFDDFFKLALCSNHAQHSAKPFLCLHIQRGGPAFATRARDRAPDRVDIDAWKIEQAAVGRRLPCVMAVGALFDEAAWSARGIPVCSDRSFSFLSWLL